jgi:hypothetical protein
MKCILKLFEKNLEKDVIEFHLDNIPSYGILDKDFLNSILKLGDTPSWVNALKANNFTGIYHIGKGMPLEYQMLGKNGAIIKITVIPQTKEDIFFVLNSYKTEEDVFVVDKRVYDILYIAGVEEFCETFGRYTYPIWNAQKTADVVVLVSKTILNRKRLRIGLPEHLVPIFIGPEKMNINYLVKEMQDNGYSVGKIIVYDV